MFVFSFKYFAFRHKHNPEILRYSQHFHVLLTFLPSSCTMGYGLTISLAFLSAFTFLGISGNTFVIFLILRKFRFESWTYTLVCHLALCDLILSAVGAPLWIATYTTKNFCICRASICTSSFFLILSGFTLILIAYDRWVYIHHPLRYQLIVTTRKVVSSLVAIWVVTLCSTILSVTYKVQTDNAVYMRNCVTSKILNRWVLIWLFLACCLVPVIVLAVTYLYILRTALRQQRRVLEFSNVEDKREKSHKLRKERQTMLMLYFVVSVFVGSSFPYATVVLLDAIDFSIVKGNRWVYLTSMLLFMNSVINPFLYTFTNKQLRKEARRILPW